MGDEELTEEGERLLVDAVRQLSADDMDRLLRGLPSPVAMEVARDLLGNKLDPRRVKNLSPLLLSPLQKRPAPRLVHLMEHLSTGILGTFQTELGDERFENPSLDDLREVLDAVLAEHPAAGVRCTLAWVVAEGMPAAAAARHLLLTEPRLCLAGWAEVPEAPHQ